MTDSPHEEPVIQSFDVSFINSQHTLLNNIRVVGNLRCHGSHVTFCNEIIYPHTNIAALGSDN